MTFVISVIAQLRFGLQQGFDELIRDPIYHGLIVAVKSNCAVTLRPVMGYFNPAWAMYPGATELDKSVRACMALSANASAVVRGIVYASIQVSSHFELALTDDIWYHLTTVVQLRSDGLVRLDVEAYEESEFQQYIDDMCPYETEEDDTMPLFDDDDDAPDHPMAARLRDIGEPLVSMDPTVFTSGEYTTLMRYFDMTSSPNGILTNGNRATATDICHGLMGLRAFIVLHMVKFVDIDVASTILLIDGMSDSLAL